MSSSCCDREVEVLEAVQAGRWQDLSDETLRRHVAACPVCADVALVARFLNEQGDLARSEAALPEAGLVWWKAQLKARRTAAQEAAQPIAIVESAAWASGAMVLLAGLIWQWPRIDSWLKGLGGYWPSLQLADSGLRDSILTLWTLHSSVLTLSLSAFLILMALVAYAVFAEK